MTLDEALAALETRPFLKVSKEDNENIRNIIKDIYGDYEEEVISDIHGYIDNYPQLGKFTPNTTVRIYAEEFNISTKELK